MLFMRQEYHVFCRDTLSIKEETAIKPHSRSGTKMYQSCKNVLINWYLNVPIFENVLF